MSYARYILHFQAVMRSLIKRYIMNKSRDKIDEGVTEDDINEIKQDVSAFRFELLEILRKNGMEIPEYGRRSSKVGSKRHKKRDVGRKMSFGFCVTPHSSKFKTSVVSNSQQASLSSSVEGSLDEVCGHHSPDGSSNSNHHHHHGRLARSKIGQIVMRRFHRHRSNIIDDDSDCDVEKQGASASTERSRTASVSFTLAPQPPKPVVDTRTNEPLLNKCHP